jgi:hypothetical protein
MSARTRLLACLLPLSLASAGCDIGIAAGRGAEVTFERNLTASGPLELDVRSGSGDIVVRTGPAGTVHVRGRARTFMNHWISFDGESSDEALRRIEQEPPIEQTGNRIRIGHVDRNRWDRWNGISISYVITVPADVRVTARSGSGDLEVGDIDGAVDATTGSRDIRVGRAREGVSARTGSGSIEVRGSRSLVARTGSGSVFASAVNGDVEASSGSGDITISQTAKGRTEVSTGSGDIEIAGATGELDVHASSGDVSVEGAPSAPWEVRSSSGDVRMRLASDAAVDLDLNSSSGGIDSSVPITVAGRQSRRELKGQLRGGGPRVHVATSSGSISVR